MIKFERNWRSDEDDYFARAMSTSVWPLPPRADAKDVGGVGVRRRRRRRRPRRQGAEVWRLHLHRLRQLQPGRPPPCHHPRTRRGMYPKKNYTQKHVCIKWDGYVSKNIYLQKKMCMYPEKYMYKKDRYVSKKIYLQKRMGMYPKKYIYNKRWVCKPKIYLQKKMGIYP